MVVENVRSKILVAAGALWVGTDRHVTEAGVWRSWKVTEMYAGATTVVYQPRGRQLGAPRRDGFNVPGKPVNKATAFPRWRPLLCDSPPVY
jgi:hypothetical protein